MNIFVFPFPKFSVTSHHFHDVCSGFLWFMANLSASSFGRHLSFLIKTIPSHYNLHNWEGLSPCPLVPGKGTGPKHSLPPGSSDWFKGRFTSETSGATREEMKVVRISVQSYRPPFYHFRERNCLKLKLDKRKTEERCRYWERERERTNTPEHLYPAVPEARISL